MPDARPIFAPPPRLADLVTPDLSVDAARREVLGVRHRLNADTRLLTGRKPDVLRALHQWLEWDPPQRS